MTIKELEKEVKEIKEMVKSLVITKQLTIDDIKVGEQFIYCGHKYTKLNESNYCIIDDFDSDFMYCIFDPISNNYNESVIRQYINSDRFINRLGVNVEDLEEAFDLCNCDKITLLSKEEYDKYKYLIKNYAAWFWLRSAVSGYGDIYAYCVNSYCCCDDYNISDGENTVRVALILKSETEVEKVNE